MTFRVIPDYQEQCFLTDRIQSFTTISLSCIVFEILHLFVKYVIYDLKKYFRWNATVEVVVQAIVVINFVDEVFLFFEILA